MYIDISHIIRKPKLCLNPDFVVSIVNVTTGREYDTAGDFINWKEIEVTFTRDGLSGLTVDDSQTFEFTGEARNMLKNMFRMHGFAADARIMMYQLGRRATSGYKIKKNLKVDFSTYSYDFRRNVVSIQGRDAEFNDYFGAKRTTNYDIKVSEVNVNGETWEYKRNQMICAGSYTGVEESRILVLSDLTTTLPLFLNNATQVPGTAEHDFKQQFGQRGSSDYFFKASSSEDVTLKLSIDMDISNYTSLVNSYGACFFIDGVQSEPVFPHPSSGSTFQIKYNGEITVPAGSTLGFGTYGSGTGDKRITIWSFREFEVTYKATGPQLNMLIVRPENLLQNILDKISGVEGYFTGRIQWPSLGYTPMFVAAETIRGFTTTDDDGNTVDNAYIHTTLKKLFDWLIFMGLDYVYDRETRTITFKDRNEIFDKSTYAIRIQPQECGNVFENAEAEHVYTSVKVNYPSSNIENVNGRFTTCVPTDYTTGYVNYEGNELNLSTDYKADPVTIELLCWERGNQTSDTRNDNDLFVVAMNEESGPVFTEKMELFYWSVEYQIGLFNAYLSPSAIIQRNASLIGITTKELAFTGTEGFRDMLLYLGLFNPIGNVYKDEDIEGQLFTPRIYDVEVASIRQLLPDKLTEGLVRVATKNGTITGFIKNVTENPVTNAVATWQLYAVD